MFCILLYILPVFINIACFRHLNIILHNITNNYLFSVVIVNVCMVLLYYVYYILHVLPYARLHQCRMVKCLYVCLYFYNMKSGLQVTSKVTGMNMDLLTSRIGLFIHLTAPTVTGRLMKLDDFIFTVLPTLRRFHFVFTI